MRCPSSTLNRYDRQLSNNQIANFPNNEHWRGCTTEESIRCDTIMPVSSLVHFRLFMGKIATMAHSPHPRPPAAPGRPRLPCVPDTPRQAGLNVIDKKIRKATCERYIQFSQSHPTIHPLHVLCATSLIIIASASAKPTRGFTRRRTAAKGSRNVSDVQYMHVTNGAPP